MSIKQIVKAKKYKVQDDDKPDTLPGKVSWKLVTKFNFGTVDPNEINIALRDQVGCRKKTSDSKNFIFSSNDDPGIIYIPEEMPETNYSSNQTHQIKVKRVTKKTFIPSKVIVRFRPQASWKGEFGFDWIREGKYGEVDYEKNVGSYGAIYGSDNGATLTVNNTMFNNLIARYSPFTVKDKDDKHIIYPTPWLSLYPEDQTRNPLNKKECKATLQINYEIYDSVPDRIRFDYDKKYFELDSQEITSKAVGMHEGATGLTLGIKCIQELKENKEIIVYTETREHNGKYKEYISGKLKILANDKDNRYRVNVVLVKVKTKINKKVHTGKIGDKRDYLKKYFHQALISINFDEVMLDLTKYDSLLSVITGNRLNSEYTTLVSRGGDNVITTSANSSGEEIFSYLEQKFNEEFGTKQYDLFYKIFIFEEDGGIGKGSGYGALDGQASDIGKLSQSVVVFKDPSESSTPHELLHSMGLFHSFDNDGAFTYTIGQTDNLMDYSDIRKFSNPTKELISTWEWQWKRLRGCAKIRKE